MSDVEIIEDQPKSSGEVKPDVPARVVSSIVGLMGFCTALVVGLLVGNPGVTIVLRALLAFVICAIVGRLIGTIGEICVREFLTKYKVDHPTPQLPEKLRRLYQERADEEQLRQQMRRSTS